MSQLSFFEATPQLSQPSSSSIAPSPRARSPQSTNISQQTQSAIDVAIAPMAHSPQHPLTQEIKVQLVPSIAPATSEEKSTLPASLNFNPLKQCRLSSAPIKHGGLDHSLCSSACGWVVDLIWLAAHPPRRPKEPEPQAATHTENSESETLDLFLSGIESTAKSDGGAA